MGRKLGRIAAYVALAFGLLGLCVYLARNPVRDLLGRTVSSLVSRGLNGTLKVGTLRGSLLSSLVLHDVVLRAQLAGIKAVRASFIAKAITDRAKQIRTASK